MKTSSGVYYDVPMFTHKMPSVGQEFVTLTLQNENVLSIMPGHYINSSNSFAATWAAQVGESVVRGRGSTSPNLGVGVRSEIGTGLLYSQTVRRDIAE